MISVTLFYPHDEIYISYSFNEFINSFKFFSPTYLSSLVTLHDSLLSLNT